MSVTALTSKNFNNFVGTQGVVLVDFWADWCAPCKAMLPVLEKASVKHAGKISFGKVDIEEEGVLAGSQNISSIPHFKLFKDGTLVGEVQGALPPKAFEDFLEKHCG